jgi:histidine phosphotransfer protein HptB
MITEIEGDTPTERFQKQTLADYSEGDHEFERDLIESYKTSIAEHLPKLEEALKTEDEKESVLHSHDIKGSSSYIGAEAVRFVSGKMEAHCKQKNMKEAAKHLQELKTEVKEVFILLDHYMKSWETEENEDEDETEDNGDKNVSSKDSHHSDD